MGSETKTCRNCKTDFVIEPDDFAFYEKIKVPPPTWCPECRAKRRLIFWNEHNLYRKKEAVEGKEVFSTYPEEANVVIYDHDYWWSDKWDAMSYGKDVDFSRPFLAQVQELNLTVPWASKSVQQMVNSDYCNQASRDKNCYLCFNGNNSEDSAYGVGFQEMKTCFDFYSTAACEFSYELFSVERCYQCFYAVDCSNCRNVWFSKDCNNCQDCIGCIGLRNKQYHILNQPCTKEEYEEKVATLNLGSYAASQAFNTRVRSLWQTFPIKFMHGLKNVDVLGDYVGNSKNVKCSFEVYDAETVKYSQNIAWGTKDSYDYTNWGLNSELIYDSISVGENCRNLKFCFDCWPNCSDLEYSMNCHSSSNLFGCVGLRSKEYCILNKQYSKEDYLLLREKIIAQMREMPYVDAKERTYPYGEMFPIEFSPLAYTETKAVDYQPLTKEQALAQGFLWREPNPREFQTTMNAADLPDHIGDVLEGISQETIACADCKRAYRIIPAEFAFYKRFTIPIPRRCHNCRYRERLRYLNPMKWHSRTCDCAGKESKSGVYNNTSEHLHGLDNCPTRFETTYAPDRPEIVYCESCYNSEVV
ncbi:MAG: hypothetical protein RL681_292 [Candidatus Parcubacteria bacterium]|jgi:uncharacterized protein YbaR (Trm112 family)